MSVVPDDWSDAGSRRGTVYEVAWMTLALVVFAAIAVVDPLSIDVTPSPVSLAGATAVGAAIGALGVYLSHVNTAVREFLDDPTRRFVAIFAFVMAGQGLLVVVPTWYVLTLIAVFAVAIPARLVVYWRHRGEARSDGGIEGG